LVIGRLSGVAVGPNGNIVALNRGYHPVLEFKSDGSFVRGWGEGSRMFEGAHTVRFDRQGDPWYIDAADNMIFHFDKEGRTVGTLGTNPEPWTWLTHVIERAVPGRANFYQQTDIGWSRDGSMFVSDGYGNSRVAKYDKDGNFVKARSSACRPSGPDDRDARFHPPARMPGREDGLSGQLLRQPSRQMGDGVASSANP
jgi:hypothetical protein